MDLEDLRIFVEVADAGGVSSAARRLGVSKSIVSRRLFRLEADLGVNPYKFGIVGSTDAHTGLAAVEEDNFFGKTSSSEPSPDRAIHPFVKTDKAVIMGWETTASGYAAVWARENTRESIFDAMQRRETYATTGPRMVVRFFGGFDFDDKDATTRMPAQIGYNKGVPMGGDLRNAPSGKIPTFLVAALKDPIGANLDRYQIVKGWLDAKGDVHENVYDVAWSGNRKPDADGDSPAAPPLSAAGPGPLSRRKVIQPEHRAQQRADDAGDHKPHHDGDRRYREGDDPLDHQARLLVVNIGGFQKHRGELGGFFAELKEVDHAPWEETRIVERPG